MKVKESRCRITAPKRLVTLATPLGFTLCRQPTLFPKKSHRKTSPVPKRKAGTDCGPGRAQDRRNRTCATQAETNDRLARLLCFQEALNWCPKGLTGALRSGFAPVTIAALNLFVTVEAKSDRARRERRSCTIERQKWALFRLPDSGKPSDRRNGTGRTWAIRLCPEL